MRRELSLAANIARSNMGRLAFPYKLTFVVTYACNYRCQTCNIWQRKPTNELTLKEIRQFFRTSSRFNWIDFTGGEPWLRRDFPDIIEAAIDHCPDLALVHFPTNGYFTKRTVEGVRQIVRHGAPRLIITVSMDGDEALNDEVRGIRGGWRRQIETFRQLHDLPGVQVVLGMTLSSLNVGRYEVAFAAAKRECPWLTPRDYHMNVVHESTHYFGNDGLRDLRDERRQEILRDVTAYRESRGVPRSVVDFVERRYLANVAGYLASGTTPMRCHALRSSCFVDSWGNVYPCAMYDAKIANLRDHAFDLEAIWNLPRTRQLQEEIWDYRCPQCWTPCEAYQSIFGNLLGRHDTRTPLPVATTQGKRRPALPVIGG